MSPANKPPPIALAIRLLSPPGVLHWHSSCARKVAAGTVRAATARPARAADLKAKRIEAWLRCNETLQPVL